MKTLETFADGVLEHLSCGHRGDCSRGLITMAVSVVGEHDNALGSTGTGSQVRLPHSCCSRAALRWQINDTQGGTKRGFDVES